MRQLDDSAVLLATEGLTKRYGRLVAANQVNLRVLAGSFTGVVGPNGAGKTTTLSMICGLLAPTAGRVTIAGHDLHREPKAAKRLIGALPDRLRLFDRLTGAQLLHYAGTLNGLAKPVVSERSAELADALGITSALGRLVSDYSAGMQKKIALAAAMVHSPKLLVLDEPFESIDPVSAATVTEMLETFVAAGGSVVLTSHSIDLIQRVCDHVVIIDAGNIVADGSVETVRGDVTLETRYRQLTDSAPQTEGLEWLHGFSG